jgi:CheY-like chemotaxis protein
MDSTPPPPRIQGVLPRTSWQRCGIGPATRHFTEGAGSVPWRTKRDILRHGKSNYIRRASNMVHAMVAVRRTALIKVLVADDADVMRRAIRSLLATDSEIQLVGEAANCAQAVQMTRDLKPQIVVMDVHMFDKSDLAGSHVKACLDTVPSQLLAISFANDEDTEALADSFGAAVLLDKMNLAIELIPTIKRYANAGLGKQTNMTGTNVFQ